MSTKKLNKKQAIEYCLEQIKPSLLGDDYNKFNQYRIRYNKGELKDKAIKTLFDRFGIIENCYYTIKDNG